MGSLINFYNTFKQEKIHNPNESLHGIKLPFRALINCASGGGKTNLVLNILYMMNNTFHDIIIVSKAEEPLYDHLVDKLKNVKIYYNG
jgi:predicted AAA+ superfamily ATPase